MKRSYYLSDSAPNGTRDLLILDDQGKETWISEACFGGNFKTVKDRDGEYLVHDGYSLGYAPLDADSTLMFPVRLKDVLSRIACSPVDPDGMSILRQIRKAGIKLGARAEGRE